MGNYLALVNSKHKFNVEDVEGFSYIEYEKENAKNEDQFPIYLEEETYKAFMGLKKELTESNINLKVVSGRRTPAQQSDIAKQIYEEKLIQFKNSGIKDSFAEEKAQEYVSSFVNKPNESEHHTGLALDAQPSRIKENFLTKLQNSFINKGDSFSLKVARKIEALDRRVMNRVVHSKLEKYGFILRYKEEDFAKTGVHSEPWHYRFVGRENAKNINRSGLCLEDFILKQIENEQIK
ncbi:MAG: D-alanyl-D-alanine carboxypeptidase family protein [Clostridia bacterium]|nr:D-alanyl-D-alanine carboxypeptidase family protein [Clostridia bacterium]